MGALFVWCFWLIQRNVFTFHLSCQLLGMEFQRIFLAFMTSRFKISTETKLMPALPAYLWLRWDPLRARTEKDILSELSGLAWVSWAEQRTQHKRLRNVYLRSFGWARLVVWRGDFYLTSYLLFTCKISREIASLEVTSVQMSLWSLVSK